MVNSFPSLVSVAWLKDSVPNAELRILDASMHLPAAGRDAFKEFESSHIPGAQFLELAALKDASSSVPDAIPTRSQLMTRLEALGVSPEHRIVLYDDSAVRTSARTWLILRSHGLNNVAILDGGLAKWREEGGPLVQSASRPEAVTHSDKADGPPKGIRSKADVLSNLDSQTEQIVDARAADRVFGAGEDPVHGGANGRIPGALNVPFGQVLNADGTYKSADSIRGVFEDAGVDLKQPVVTSCGSGVTASVLTFALHLAGKDDVALYDGSWQEWGSDPDTPKAQGPQ